MSRHERVLIVADDPDLVAEARDDLEQRTVMVASTAAEALALLARQGFDVVISDVALPGVDGRPLLETVRERWPTIARVLIADSEQQLRGSGAHVAILRRRDPISLGLIVASLYATSRTDDSSN